MGRGDVSVRGLGTWIASFLLFGEGAGYVVSFFVHVNGYGREFIE